jgi:predicted class III extradiol MEMO1 family dioxygenase
VHLPFLQLVLGKFKLVAIIMVTRIIDVTGSGRDLASAIADKNADRGLDRSVDFYAEKMPAVSTARFRKP